MEIEGITVVLTQYNSIQCKNGFIKLTCLYICGYVLLINSMLIDYFYYLIVNKSTSLSCLISDFQVRKPRPETCDTLPLCSAWTSLSHTNSWPTLVDYGEKSHSCLVILHIFVFSEIFILCCLPQPQVPTSQVRHIPQTARLLAHLPVPCFSPYAPEKNRKYLVPKQSLFVYFCNYCTKYTLDSKCKILQTVLKQSNLFVFLYPWL